MLVYRGEQRYLSVDMAAVLAEGDTLSGTPTVVIYAKRGRAATTLVVNVPAAPAVVGTEVRFWVLIPAASDPLAPTQGNYLAKASCDTAMDETVVEEAPLIVQ